MIEKSVREIINEIDKDPEREGLSETPKRHIKFLKEFTTPPEFNFTTFKQEINAEHDEMVIVKDIPFYSLCEHHLVPFFGTAAIGYLPGDCIVGLSKIPRVLDMYARQFQNQERITQQVASYLMTNLLPKGVAVVLSARHLCVEMRGVEKPGTVTITSAMRGKFRSEVNTRQEFLNLIK